MGKPGNQGEYQPTAKNLLIFPTRKFLLNKFIFFAIKSVILSVTLKCCNVNRSLFSIHSDLMCLWYFCFLAERKFFEGNKTCVFLLSWATETNKPKPFYLIEFSLDEFVISIIVSRLKFVQSLLFAFYTASASSPL